jgi:hypothetical protein
MLGRKLLPAAITATAITLSTLSIGAQAGAVATSYLEVSNFKFYNNTTGNALVLGTGASDSDADFFFSGSGISNNGDTGAGLNGTEVGDGTNSLVDGSGVFDVLASCVGNCTYAENSFNYIPAGTDAIATYVVGDIFQTGGAVNLSESFTGEKGGTVLPAINARTLAEVSLTGPGKGTSSGNNAGAAGKFTFRSESAGNYRVDFSLNPYLYTSIAGGSSGLLAQASWAFSININELDDNGDAIPCGTSEFDETTCTLSFGRLVSRSVTGTGSSEFNTGLAARDYFGSIEDDGLAATERTFAIAGDTNYQVTITQVSSADAELVPAPGTIALLGLGLLGLVGIRRKNAQASS